VAPASQLKVVGADPKELLLPQLGDIGRVNERPLFTFKVKVNGADVSMHTLIYGLVSRGGSGELWQVFGYFDYNQYYSRPFYYHQFPQLENYRSFVCEYNSRLRTGWMEPHEK
jgi:hypothetical protein